MGRAERASRIPVPRSVEQTLDAALDRALAIQHPAVVAYLHRVRRRKPGASPTEVVDMLERRYLAAVIGTGAAAGGAAAVPGVGTTASVASAAGEVAAFVSATAMYVLALAAVHDVPTHDPQVRRALVLSVLLGDIGAAMVAGGEVEAKHWARVLGHTSSKDKTKLANSKVTHLLLARFGAKQGALALGRVLPFGIGAGIGAAGNAALGRGVIRTARLAFGLPPARFPGHVVDVDVAAPADPAVPARRSVHLRKK